MEQKVGLLNNSDEIEKKYIRTLQFIFIKASLDLFPNSVITIQHSVGKGIFGEIFKEKPLDEKDVEEIKKKMEDLIQRDLPINKIKVTKEEAIKIFKGYKMYDKVQLLEQVDLKEVNLYELEGRYDYFYGHIARKTSAIKAFDLIYYENGFILRRPNDYEKFTLPEFVEQRKITKIFRETENWLNILEVGTVASLNSKIDNGELANLVMISEALHEKKIAEIADKIQSRNEIKLVLIAGPSSSGKTTFANRLGIQLRVIGSVDVELFNKHLNLILQGKEVEIPEFNFKKGEREWVGKKVKLPKNGVVIIEGIHGLNPILTSHIDEIYKFKIYISALTQLNLDNHNRITTTDVRKIRRIVRDSLSRGHGAEDTLKMWPKIKRGEEKNIFVYQEEADVMFNSTLVYELSVLKKYALKELDKIEKDSIVYEEAKRLKSFLGFFREVEKNIVPENSILREFIGGSIFYKY